MTTQETPFMFLYKCCQCQGDDFNFQYSQIMSSEKKLKSFTYHYYFNREEVPVFLTELEKSFKKSSKLNKLVHEFLNDKSIQEKLQKLKS